MKKRIVFLLFLSTLFGPPIKAMSEMNIVVYNKDGSRVAYLLEEKPKLVFTTIELLISIKAMEIHYSMKDIDKLSYEVVNTAGIVTIKAENKIEYADGAILYSSKKNEQISDIRCQRSSCTQNKSVGRRKWVYVFVWFVCWFVCNNDW